MSHDENLEIEVRIALRCGVIYGVFEEEGDDFWKLGPKPLDDRISRKLGLLEDHVAACLEKFFSQLEAGQKEWTGPHATFLLTKIIPEMVAPAKQEKNPDAVALGRLGGKKGGPARARQLSPERRQEISRHAAKTRWGKRSWL